MNIARQPEQRTFAPGERVPYSGLYTIYHNDSYAEADPIVLLESQLFPTCKDCGSDVRFELLRAAPHILDDEDFSGDGQPSPQPAEEKS